MHQQQQQQSTNPQQQQIQQHALSNQQSQSSNHNMHQQDKVGGGGSVTVDGSMSNSFRGNDQVSHFLAAPGTSIFERFLIIGYTFLLYPCAVFLF